MILEFARVAFFFFLKFVTAAFEQQIRWSCNWRGRRC